MAEKGPSKGQKSKFRKTEKNLFSHSPKKHILKILGCWVENCGLQLGNRHTDTQTKKQRQRQPFQGFRSSSLQPFVKQRSKKINPQAEIVFRNSNFPFDVHNTTFDKSWFCVVALHLYFQNNLIPGSKMLTIQC